MITPLNPSRFEAGVAAYVVARLAAGPVTVAAPSGETSGGEAPRVAPEVIPAVSKQENPVAAPCVWVSVRKPEAKAAGLYAVEFVVAVVTPLAVEGVLVEDHLALADAVAGAFPNRPGLPGAGRVAWEVLEAEFSAASLAACGHVVRGWFASGGDAIRAGDRWEQVWNVSACVLDPSL